MQIYVLCCNIHIFRLWSGQLSLCLLLAFSSPLQYDFSSCLIPWVLVCLHIHLSCAFLVPVVIRRGWPVLWDWSFRWLGVIMWVLWIEPVGAGSEATSAFNQLPICLLRMFFLYSQAICSLLLPYVTASMILSFPGLIYLFLI